jgi:hypothetical protein
LARIYIIESIKYLPPPFDNLYFTFFGRVAEGQIEKRPKLEVLINSVYNLLSNPFSEWFWKHEGSSQLNSLLQNLQTILYTLQKKEYRQLIG